MRPLLMICLGGAAGTAARYGVNLVAPSWLRPDFPFATLAVNARWPVGYPRHGQTAGPRDPSQLAELILDMITGDAANDSPDASSGAPEPASCGFGAPLRQPARHHMHYNFARIHKSLRVTPAMEAGVADHVGLLEEIAELAA